jgi:hypothetical protein
MLALDVNITPIMTESEIECVQRKLGMLSRATCPVCVSSVRQRVSALQNKLDDVRANMGLAGQINPSGGGFVDDVQNCPVCMEEIDCTESCISIYCPGSNQVPYPSAKQTMVVCSKADIDKLLAKESEDSPILLNCGHKVHAGCLSGSLGAGSSVCPSGCNALVAPQSARTHIPVPVDYYGDPIAARLDQDAAMLTTMTEADISLSQCGIDALLSTDCAACSSRHHERAKILQDQLDKVRQNGDLLSSAWTRQLEDLEPIVGNFELANTEFNHDSRLHLEQLLRAPSVFLDSQQDDLDVTFASGLLYLAWSVLSVFDRQFVDKTPTEAKLREPYCALQQARTVQGVAVFLDNLQELSRRLTLFYYNHVGYDEHLGKEDSFALYCDYMYAMQIGFRTNKQPARRSKIHSLDKLPKAHSSPTTPLGNSGLGMAWVRMAERVRYGLTKQPFPDATIEQYNDLLDTDFGTLMQEIGRAKTYPEGWEIMNFLMTQQWLWRLEPQEDFDVDANLPSQVQTNINQKLLTTTLEIPTLFYCLEASEHGNPESPDGSYFAWVREILHLNGIRIDDVMGGAREVNANTSTRTRHPATEPEREDGKAVVWMSAMVMVAMTMFISVIGS